MARVSSERAETYPEPRIRPEIQILVVKSFRSGKEMR